MQVNGQYSQDLDLFYKAEDAEQLFNVQTEKYKQICTLAIDALAVKSTNEKKFNEISEQLTEQNVFNYLSEKKAARDTLYNVCLFAHFEDESKRTLLHDNRETFNSLF